MNETPYMACNGCCFMVYRMLRQAHLKEVNLTQKQETMTIHSLATLDILQLFCEERPTWIGR